ncbi:MAG: elongation factor P [Candidatus Omnitrophota bacterium]
MLGINELKTGLTVKIDGNIYLIVGYQQVKPGKGASFVRVKLKNMLTDSLIDRTFRSSEKIEEAFVNERRVQYLYEAGGTYHFMDTETYDQLTLGKEQMGDASLFMKENMVITLQEHDGQILNVAPPMFVELKVIETEPGLRGDTAKGGTKAAKVETGATIQVPLFVDVGNVLKIDTRTGTYVSRI